MSQMLPVKIRIVGAVLGLGLTSCTPQSPQETSSPTTATSPIEANGATAADETVQSAEARVSTSTPNPAKESSGTDIPVKPQRGTSPEMYVAVLKKAIAIPLLAPTGTVSVKNGCLVATIDDVDYTAVLPPQARLVGPSDVPTAIKLSRRSVLLGRPMSLPAGGVEFSPADLRAAIPANCPEKSIVFAG